MPIFELKAVMIETVGLVGVGTMGEPMGESLLRAGFALHVCAHRNRARVERLVALGAKDHASPADVAAACQLTITMVPDAPQVEEAIFGPHGIIGGARRGSIVVDMSTISPVASRTFHERAAQSGLQMLDAPVSGGPARAATGQLTIMAGGDQATYEQAQPYGPYLPGEVAGVDLGEVHLAVAHDGKHTHILNGRLLRSKAQYRNKLQARLTSRIDGRMNKGSKRRKRLIRSKKRQLKKIEHQIADIEHQQTTRLITTLHEDGVRIVAIGDVRDIRQVNDVGHTNNQKIHQWSHGSVRRKLTYKAKGRQMYVVLQEESYTSRTCPHCHHVRSKVRGRVFRCPRCGWTYHRDGVGAINIRARVSWRIWQPPRS